MICRTTIICSNICYNEFVRNITTNVSLQRFFSKYRLLEYRKGERIVRAGDSTDRLFFILKGYIRQYAVSDTGEELTLYLYKPGNCFFLPWCFGVSENHQEFEALTPTTVYQAPRRDVFIYLLEHSHSLIKVAGGAFVGLSVLMIHMESLVYGTAVRKIASVLLILSKWFGEKRGKTIVIIVPLTHRLLATMVGLSRETTSVALTELKKQGLLTYRGRRIAIRNQEMLQRVSGISLDHINQPC